MTDGSFLDRPIVSALLRRRPRPSAGGGADLGFREDGQRHERAGESGTFLAQAEHDAAVLRAAAEADAGVVYDWVRCVRSSAEAEAAALLEEARTAAETVRAKAHLDAASLLGDRADVDEQSMVLHRAEAEARRMLAAADAARFDAEKEVAELRGHIWSELEALQAEILEEALEEVERLLAEAATQSGRPEHISRLARQIVNRAYKTSAE